MKSHKKHGTHGIRLQLGLLVLLVVTGSVMIGTSFAKYVASASHSGTARVSPFVVESVGHGSTSLRLDADAGKNNDSYSFSVTNSANGVTCAVKTEYDVEVVLPGQLSDEVKMILMREDREVAPASVSEDGLTYRYDAGIFEAAQGETHHFTLVFRGENGITEAFALNGIRISAYAAQVD